MVANELRIGNLVNVVYKGEVKAQHTVEVGTFGMLLEGFDTEGFEFEPIPLTEEWLLKFGYKKTRNIWYVLGHAIYEPTKGMYVCDKNGVILKYVHQLQNLYYALTNKELTQKLK